ncbi:hypothetical protein FRB96_001582 [Tulasnella sp. 330]|nr:hypothetical protein FRB96_001582 [Tulasnella sp. 330]KAG8878389.1 hypothetical protein FRB97_002552 [Tulasnella sp. 331]
MDTKKKDDGPIIAIDMDDVLCQTVGALTESSETREKLKVFQQKGHDNIEPVAGSLEALCGLRSMGFRLIIITARSHEDERGTMEWLEKYLPDVFQEVIFTSHFAVMDQAAMNANPWAGKSKAEVIKAKDGVLLIDDSLENAMICASQGIHVMLFGGYPWSTRHSTTTGPLDLLSRSERIKAGDDKFWERDVMGALPEHVEGYIRRVPGWMEVLEWVKERGLGLNAAPLKDLESLGDEVIVS